MEAELVMSKASRKCPFQMPQTMIRCREAASLSPSPSACLTKPGLECQVLKLRWNGLCNPMISRQAQVCCSWGGMCWLRDWCSTLPRVNVVKLVVIELCRAFMQTINRSPRLHVLLAKQRCCLSDWAGRRSNSKAILAFSRLFKKLCKQHNVMGLITGNWINKGPSNTLVPVNHVFSWLYSFKVREEVLEPCVKTNKWGTEGASSLFSWSVCCYRRSANAKTVVRFDKIGSGSLPLLSQPRDLIPEENW